MSLREEWRTTPFPNLGDPVRVSPTGKGDRRRQSPPGIKGQDLVQIGSSWASVTWTHRGVSRLPGSLLATLDKGSHDSLVRRTEDPATQITFIIHCIEFSLRSLGQIILNQPELKFPFRDYDWFLLLLVGTLIQTLQVRL